MSCAELPWLRFSELSWWSFVLLSNIRQRTCEERPCNCCCIEEDEKQYPRFNFPCWSCPDTPNFGSVNRGKEKYRGEPSVLQFTNKGDEWTEIHDNNCISKREIKIRKRLKGDLVGGGEGGCQRPERYHVTVT